MFAENGDQVGIRFGLQGFWKRLVAGRSLEEETTRQATNAKRMPNVQSAGGRRDTDPPSRKKKQNKKTFDDGCLISTIISK